MKLRAILLIALVAPVLALAGFKPGPGWPEVMTPFFHAATLLERDARIRQWRGTPGFSVQGYRDTKSMRPVLQGGRELLALETCQPLLPLTVGQIVLFDRGDRLVVHYIAAISGDGAQIYLTGVNCRNSDGWFAREKIRWIVREIIPLPLREPSVAPARLVVQSR